MKNIHKLAAIDIGSNAVRLLITSITIVRFKRVLQEQVICIPTQDYKKRLRTNIRTNFETIKNKK